MKFAVLASPDSWYARDLARAAAADHEIVATNVGPVEPASDRPHVLRGAVADVLVRLYGGACSGTPITGTAFVFTAAHCVLTDSGEVTRRTVVRDGIRYPAASVLVDPGYLDHPSAARDAAVLVMAQPIPGGSVGARRRQGQGGDHQRWVGESHVSLQRLGNDARGQVTLHAGGQGCVKRYRRD